MTLCVKKPRGITVISGMSRNHVDFWTGQRRYEIMYRIIKYDAISILDNVVPDHGYTQVPDDDGKKYFHTQIFNFF